MSKNTIKLAVVGFSIVAITAVTSGMLLSRDNNDVISVKDVSVSNQETAQPSDASKPAEDAQVPAVETTDESIVSDGGVPADQRAVNKPAAQVASATTVAPAPASATPAPVVTPVTPVTTPVTPPVIPPTPVTPTDPVEETPVDEEEPAAEPTFQIDLREHDAVIEGPIQYPAPYDLPEDMRWFVVPFDVITDEGFAFDWSEMLPFWPYECTILEAPVADHGMLCHAGPEKEGNDGWVSAQYDNSTARGHYVVAVSMYYQDTVRTDILEFDLIDLDTVAVYQYEVDVEQI